jgi:hypothetical protein
VHVTMKRRGAAVAGLLNSPLLMKFIQGLRHIMGKYLHTLICAVTMLAVSTVAQGAFITFDGGDPEASGTYVFSGTGAWQIDDLSGLFPNAVLSWCAQGCPPGSPAQTITMARADGEVFSLLSIDAAALFVSDVNPVVIEGTLASGGTVTESIILGSTLASRKSYPIANIRAVTSVRFSKADSAEVGADAAIDNLQVILDSDGDAIADGADCAGPEPCVPEIISVGRYDSESMSASVTLAGGSENDPTRLEIATWCSSEALPDYTLLAVESVVDTQSAITTVIPLAASGEPPYLCYFTATNEAGTSEEPNYVNYANRNAFNHVTVMAFDGFRETIQGKIQLMYIGLLQRAADRAGLAYWSRDFYNGVSVDGIRASFVPSEEFQTFWGDRDRGEFLNALYRIYFNREPDQAGFDYWVSGGGSGVRVDQLAQTFIDAAGVIDQLALENKAVVASHYTSLYASYDRDAIKAILETVDNTEESVAAAIQAIDENYTVLGDI